MTISLSDIKNKPSNISSVREYCYEVYYFRLFPQLNLICFFINFNLFKARYNDSYAPFYSVMNTFDGNSWGNQILLSNLLPTPGQNFTISISCDSQNWIVS